MGPALTRLFEESECGPIHVEHNPGESAEYALCQSKLEGYAIGDVYQRATANRLALLYTHGEALIAALESILAADERGQGLPFAEAMQRAAALLAQLESEAQP